MAAYNKDGYDGIGIGCFNIIGMIDVDDCICDGKLDMRGKDIVNTMDSYTELSPSGKGIHIFYLIGNFDYNRNRYYINNRQNHVEVYVPQATNRFLTITGLCIYGTDVAHRSEKLECMLEKYMLRNNTDAEETKVAVPGSFLSEENVLQKMFYPDKAKRLRHYGMAIFLKANLTVKQIWLWQKLLELLWKGLMSKILKKCREQESKSKPSVFIGTSSVQLIFRQSMKKRHNLHCRKLCRYFQSLKIPKLRHLWSPFYIFTTV